MRLLIATPSPFARKVRVVLREKGIACEEVVDNPWQRDAQAPTLNPLGQVPALDLVDGQTLYDSRVIVGYLETLDRPPPLLGDDARARVAHRQVEALADGVCDAVVLIVLERARAREQQSPDWLRRQHSKVEAGVARAALLLEAREWYVDGRFGLTDVSVGCMLGYLELRLPEFGWRDRFSELDAFSRRLEQRPSFRDTRPVVQPVVPSG